MKPLIKSGILTPKGIVKNGLVAWYKFNEGAGQVLTDYKDGNHGQLGSAAGEDANDPAWSAAGLTFDGGDYIDCGTGAALDVTTGDYTLVAAFMSSVNALSPIIGKNTFGTNGWGMYTQNLNVRFQIRGSGAGTAILNSTPITPGGNYLYTARKTDGIMSLYENNSMVAQAFTTETPVTATTKFMVAVNPGISFYLTGAVYYALVYSRSLSTSEIAKNYRAIKKELAGRGVVLA